MTRLSNIEREALLTFYRATGANLRAEYLEKGWLPWASIDRENVEAIRSAHEVLTAKPLKVAA